MTCLVETGGNASAATARSSGQSPPHTSETSSTDKKNKSTYCKQYYERNREKRILQSKEYQRRNRDKVRAYRQQNRDKELARMKVYNKMWYQQNRDKVLARLKQYRKQNPEKEAKWVKDYRQRNKDKINQRKRERYSKRKRSGMDTPSRVVAAPAMALDYVLNNATTEGVDWTPEPSNLAGSSWLPSLHPMQSALPPPKTSLSFLLNA
ncbi:hypothetical protein H310_14349 [Aphanomyces invadans]|uniref:Uncharacterized protein n=1 Tax=Aphanomyces invadans TaxID=157072 RepID=A0A024TAD0_9STRA|nr:hypothetical protein H310_14349 [Aphanomyces invadans]ETV90934.1 hypothetical protein H310_14349 [Aphanomyces invadans]|eukprot:XP_008880416.1 hypothetical protein H310_14349 [Aphanomyces invadans]